MSPANTAQRGVTSYGPAGERTRHGDAMTEDLCRPRESFQRTDGAAERDDADNMGERW